MVHLVMEAEKSHDLLSASWKPKKAKSIDSGPSLKDKDSGAWRAED